MPRPKRTKISRPAVLVPGPRVIPSTEPVETDPVPTIAPDARPFDDLYDVSDEELNRSASAKKLNKGKALPTRSSGRNASRNVDTESRNAKDTTKPKDTPELGSGDNDMRISSSPEIEAGRRGRRTSALDNSVLAIGNFRRRAREPSILGRQTSRARSSSIDSDLAEENGLTSVGKRNTSGLGLGTFRGRAGSRRPSSVAGDRPEIGSVLRLGNFKRRAREPSILGTAQKPQQPRPTFDSDSDSDGFAPEDESTPLKFAKSRTQPSSSSSRKRKRSSVQVPRSQEATQVLPTLSKLPVDDDNDDDSELEDEVPATAPMESDGEKDDLPELEKEPSPEDLPLPSIERVATPEPMSETMAPPLGSSSSLSPAQSLPSPPPPPQPVLNPRQAIARPRRIINPRTPPRVSNTALQSSPISSPPSLTHSPDIPTQFTSKRLARKAAPQPATLSTAALQALLPRRRQRNRSALEVESSDSEVDVTGLGENDDELTITVAPTTRRQASVRPSASSTKRTQKSQSEAKGKGKRTYGKKPVTTNSDKENEVGTDDSLVPIQDEAAPEELPRENSSGLEKRIGKELRKAAKKFQEVDKWELDFEECEASSDHLAR